MRSVGTRQVPPTRAHLQESGDEYFVQLEVPEFAKTELTVEACGPVVTVRGDQTETEADEGRPFRLHETLQESFRLPDDADLDNIHVLFKHGVLELRVPRVALAQRRLVIERRRSGLLLDPEVEGL